MSIVFDGKTANIESASSGVWSAFSEFNELGAILESNGFKTPNTQVESDQGQGSLGSFAERFNRQDNRQGPIR